MPSKRSLALNSSISYYHRCGYTVTAARAMTLSSESRISSFVGLLTQRVRLCRITSALLISAQLQSLAQNGKLPTPVNQSTVPEATVEFVARGMQIPGIEDKNGLLHDFSPGHVFMILSLPTNSGIKEDAFGFYPKDGVGIIKGPGMLRSEFRCGPTDDCNPDNNHSINRWAEIKDSVTVGITLEQRRQILTEVNKWDAESSPKIYRADADPTKGLNNCIDFVDAVVRVLGYPTPPRSKSTLPTTYLENLKYQIKQEDALRLFEAQKRAEEARARADALAKAERDAREKAEAEAEAQRIPVGWMQCTCPNAHAKLGKWVNGKLYHSPAIRCPQ
jgi:hypothetical protein